MPFRVLIAGPKHFHDYATLRAILDAPLARCLPDVKLLTCGGAGVAILDVECALAAEG
jgi:hypothetical protein